MPSIAEIRQKYPQYNDLKDTELADAFHKNFYSDIPKDKFYETLGIPSQPIVDPLTAETNKAAIQAIGTAIPEPVKEAAGTVADVAQQGFEALPAPIQSAARTTGNFLLDALDILQRPFQAVAVGGKSAFQEASKEGGPTTVFELPILNKAADTLKGLSREKVRTAAVEGAARGFKGEEKASTQELLSDEFRKANPIKASVIGFAGDVLIDPLGLVAGAPFKVAKEIGSAIPGSSTIPTKLMDNDLFRAINVTVGDVDKARETYNKYRYLRDKARMEGVRDAKKLNKQFKQLSKESGIPVNELKAKLLQDIETADLSDGMLGQMETNIVRRNREVLEQQRAAGVNIGDLGESYMPHVLSKESDDLLTQMDKKNLMSTRPGSSNPNSLKREIEGTVAEINAKNLYGTAKYFEDDPALLIGLQEFRAANAIAGQKFFNDLAELGVKADEAPAHYESIFIKKDKNNKELVDAVKGYKFDPAVASYAKHSYRMLTDDQAMAKFLKVYDGAQNWWKMWSLGVRPAYHAKNLVGNMWNAYLGGLNSPKPYGQAAAFQAKLAADKLTGTIAGKPVKELYEEMTKRGVFGEGQYSYAEFSNVLRRELEPTKATDLITPSTRNAFLRAGFKVGQTVEDNARIALFLDQVQKGKTYEQAARQVQKYLFDYGDVSAFEQGVLKRAMPFYTWSRRNIPLQLEAIVRHPERVNKLNLGIENIQRAYGAEVPDPSEIPEYVAEAGPVYLGEGQMPGTQAAVTLSNLIPFMDLAPFTKFLNTKTVPQGPAKNTLEGASAVMGPISPLIKTPIELLTNYDFFRKQSLEAYEGQTVDLLGIEMTPWQAKILSNIVVLSELDRLNPGEVFGVRSVDPETGNVITKPGIFGVERESRIDMPEERRGLQYLTGIRIFDIDKDKAEIARINKIKSDLNAIKGKINKAAENDKSRELRQAEAALDKFFAEMDAVEAAIEERKNAKKAQ